VPNRLIIVGLLLPDDHRIILASAVRHSRVRVLCADVGQREVGGGSGQVLVCGEADDVAADAYFDRVVGLGIDVGVAADRCRSVRAGSGLAGRTRIDADALDRAPIEPSVSLLRPSSCRSSPRVGLRVIADVERCYWPAAELSSYKFALAEAQRLGNRRAVRKLQAIGPPPYTAKAVFTERTWLTRFEVRENPRGLLKMGRGLLGGPESSLLELPSAWRGFRFSMDAMWAEVSQLNLIELVPELQMPVFFLLGRNDRFVPPETSVTYFDALSAPAKKLVWFEHSGHEPFVDEPDKFNAALAELVRSALLSHLPAHAA
jgi:pimeloyl-ACP methyl ester carboxylesterase